MATLPSIGGGYQYGDGNLNEIPIEDVALPLQTATSTASLTTAQVLNGMLVGSPSTTAATYTLPTVALVEAVMANAKVGSYFELIIINLGTSTGVITLAVGTGWTITGQATMPTAAAGSSGTFRCVKTAAGAWTAYRVA
jgi:hypothetical protein